jgi:hypothetical protein
VKKCARCGASYPDEFDGCPKCAGQRLAIDKAKYQVAGATANGCAGLLQWGCVAPLSIFAGLLVLGGLLVGGSTLFQGNALGTLLFTAAGLLIIAIYWQQRKGSPGKQNPVAPQPTVVGLPGGGGEAARQRRIQVLEAAAAEQSRSLLEYENGYPAEEVFELGRRWALLFDETRDPEHRAKALSAMKHARSIDSQVGKGFFSDEEQFGSLATDPEFREFV